MTSLVCLVVANMVGAGVYTTSGYSLQALGSPTRVLAMWAIAAVIAITGAIAYGGLSRQLVRSGGEYLFLSRAVHPLAGFMAGWISLLAGFTGAIAFAATTFVNYLPANLQIDSSREKTLVAVGLIICAALLHLFRTGTGAIGQNILVCVKLVAIALFIAIGLAAVDWPSAGAAADSAAAPGPDFSTYANQLMWISFSFAGFNASIYVAGEAKLGRRTVRRSMLFAAIGVSVLYLLINTVFLCTAPQEAIVGRGDIAAVVAKHLGGERLGLAVQLLVALSLATSVTAMLQAGPRVYVKMAEDGMLPAWLIPDGDVPRVAIVLQAVLAAVLVCAASIHDLLDYTSFLLSVSAGATVLCLLLPRFRGQPGKRPVVLWPVLPAFFVVATLGIAVVGCLYRYQQSPTSLMLSLAVVASGIGVYRVRPGRSGSR
ncbi:Serine/threonine exchanger SteT [Rosistilla carotiformis]|uniref:Serine/threonine exchanger SteT n=2 Tax=Rosistilla carotiformis TaxID=2528017 RepID=A0A518JSV3_9BACT|nr:Serine/threonine exchanger SteT [Rosistilla carotiformis]